MVDLEPATTTLGRTVDAIRDDQLDRPTPCDVALGTLLVHVLGLTVAFREVARKVVGPVTDTPPRLGADALPPELAPATGAARRPGDRLASTGRLGYHPDRRVGHAGRR